MANALEYSIAVAAPAFPRDPLNVNVYLEHVLVGQVLEPLFILGEDGLVKGGVAEKWEFNSDHKELTIFLRKNLKFSNGKALTSEDVKFSLSRHLTNEKSQSYNYLKVIKTIEILNSSTLKFYLHNKYIPFLLTLSRDQLGILPNNWSFDPESNEPYIGTGPYRIIKEKKNWSLQENKQYRNQSDIKIPKWRIDIIDTAKNIYPEKPSDLYFLIPKTVKEQLVKQFPILQNNYSDSKAFSFVQYSFWWLKNNFNQFSIDERNQIREALETLSSSIVDNSGGTISTGIIPPGISGSLNERPKYNKTNLRKKINIQIIVPQVLIELITNELKKIDQLAKGNVKISLVPYSLSEISKIKESTCQLALISFAGGFYDPEGYLSVLPSMLGRTTKELFGTKAETVRLIAEHENNGTKRADFYREFSKITQEEVRYIPGWIPIFSDIRNTKLIKNSTAFKYGYRLIDFQEK